MSDIDLEDRTGAPAREANPKNAWTIKGLPPERREVITSAAHRAEQTVAEFVWEACDAKIRANREPLRPSAAAQLPAPLEANQMPMHGANLVELFDMVCKVASVEVTKGNARLMGEARAILRAQLAPFKGSSLQTGDGPAQAVAPPILTRGRSQSTMT